MQAAATFARQRARGAAAAARRDLEWLCQKDALGQDALLICAPAERARARRAAFAFAELVNAEAFYVGVSPDTAEADLRQRRELTGGGSAAWSDAAPVRAALAGAS